jgi:hypothetical protein
MEIGEINTRANLELDSTTILLSEQPSGLYYLNEKLFEFHNGANAAG